MTKLLINLLLCLGLTIASCDFSSYYCGLAGITCPSVANTISIDGAVYSPSDFGVISFDELTITHGDTQDRVAVRNNFYGFNGISVADLQNGNKQFSLIVGGNMNWNDNGLVTGDVYVGNLASAVFPSSISGNVKLGCSTAGCLDSSFDSIKSYFQQFSSNLALQNSNVDISIGEDKIATVTCQGSANLYIARTNPASFSSIVGYQISSSCSASAAWIFNIIGEGEVLFAGNAIQASGTVLFNIAPASKVVVGASVYGNILAPFSDINMVRGVITGQVIAGNVSNIVQVNIVTCPASTGSASSSSASSDSASSASASSASASSASSSSGDSASSASGSSSDSSSASASSSSSASAGITTAVDPTAIISGIEGATNVENSGVFMSCSFVLIAALIALI